MKLAAIAFAAALVPATAFAGGQNSQNVPAQNQNQNQDQQNQSRFEVDTYESQVSQGGLGLTVVGLTPDLRGHFGAPRDSGLLVAHVQKDSPAERAGIRVGDVLTRIGNDKITTPDDIDSSLSRIDRKNNQKIAVEVIRDHKMMNLQAAAMPST
ncbi:MAG TPA: PDZ domain-containing protein [Kofleriaceae bacterium]|jgi:S1-C subfamily serine protease